MSDDVRQMIADEMARLDQHELTELFNFVRARTAFRSVFFEPRSCDHCGRPYQGPAVYCSLRCACAAA